ncbi:hypothetical protein LCGC14_1065680 [marine sediment metagenome]|uniref:Uncharacterized protein n=1 Tax=marine sediment metagenome TaxID=412755 RepID=A0A0F9N6Q4_9ZZZZ
MTENAKAANFGDIFLNLETNYDVNCQLISFDVTKHNEKGNRYQDCVLYDGFDQNKVKIWEGRNGIPLEEKNRNQWLTFSLSARAGSGKWANNKYLGGFWDSSAAVIDTPQNTQQAPPQAAQPTNVPQNVDMRMPDTYAYPVTPETSRRMARAVVITAMLRSGQKPLLSYAEELVEFIVSGIDVSKVPDPDAEITVCPHCKKPHPECSCKPAF